MKIFKQLTVLNVKANICCIKADAIQDGTCATLGRMESVHLVPTAPTSSMEDAINIMTTIVM